VEAEGDFDHARVAGGWVNVLVVVCGGKVQMEGGRELVI
jgi:hypothetical protein